MTKRIGVDWRRVATILRARAEDEMITCPYCKAQGSVPYIAEHVLQAHRESPAGRSLARVVLAAR